MPSSNGMLDAHFGHCKAFAIIDIENDIIVSEKSVDAPPHQPGLLPPWLAERGVTDVIAGGMGQRAIDIFTHHGINVFVGAPQLSPALLAEGFVKGTITFNANYCDH